MKKLSEQQKIRLEAATGELRECATAVTNAIEMYNVVMVEHLNAIKKAAANYEDIKDNVETILNEYRHDMMEYYDDQTMAWHESDEGAKYSEWVESYDVMLDWLSMEYPPDQIEIPEFTAFDQICVLRNNPKR